ncbi:hypothetical protein D3C87_991850 [compost metagenome]
MDKILEILKVAAPTVATALGGPLAGLAVKFLADKLGVPPEDEEAIVNAVQGMDQQTLVQMKQMDVEFQKFLRQNQIDLERIAASDRADARNLMIQTKSVVPAILSIGVTVGYFTILTLMLRGELKVGDSQALLLMLGGLGSAWGAIMQYWFGSSASSANKDATIRAQATTKK